MKNPAIATSISLLALAAILVFYGTTYFLHHDLAGGILTSALAVELSAEFDRYNAYFPPIEKYWYMLAVQLGNAFGIGADQAYVAQMVLAVVFSAGLGYVIRQRTVGADILFFVGPLVVFLIVPILFKNIFGLREHLIILGLWPYLVLRAAGEKAAQAGLSLRVILGLWMGFTLLFKYFYSILIFLVEATDAVISRRVLLLFRIENIIAGLIVFAYLFVWLGLDPAQREVIMAMRAAIAANISSTASSLNKVLVLFGIAVVVWSVLYIIRIPPRRRALGLALVIGAVIVAWLQERWYTHHLFPIFMAFVGWWWLVGAAFRIWAHGLVVLMLFLPLSDQFSKTHIYTLGTAEVRTLLADAGISLTGQRVGLLNQHPSPFNQVILAEGGVRWSPQVNIAYVSTALLPFDTPRNEGKTPPPVTLDKPSQQLLHNRLLALWESTPPDVLILDTSRQWPLRYVDFHWEQVLSQDARFQRILARFTPVFTHDSDLANFAYYVRTD